MAPSSSRRQKPNASSRESSAHESTNLPRSSALKDSRSVSVEITEKKRCLPSVKKRQEDVKQEEEEEYKKSSDSGSRTFRARTEKQLRQSSLQAYDGTDEASSRGSSNVEESSEEDSSEEVSSDYDFSEGYCRYLRSTNSSTKRKRKPVPTYTPPSSTTRSKRSAAGRSIKLEESIHESSREERSLKRANGISIAAGNSRSSRGDNNTSRGKQSISSNFEVRPPALSGYIPSELPPVVRRPATRAACRNKSASNDEIPLPRSASSSPVSIRSEGSGSDYAIERDSGCSSNSGFIKKKAYGLRNRKAARGATSSTGTSSDGRRRNPDRLGRPDPKVFIAPDLNESLYGEPTKKKPKKVAEERSNNSSSFEPSHYFPTKDISFDTIGGCFAIKQELKQSVLGPFRKQMMDAAVEQDPNVPKKKINSGALFWGPPGTGKTLMAKALAYECCPDSERALPVYVISGAELLTKWVGESEGRLREIFRQASDNSPSMIFIDELDGLVRRRTNAETDGVNFNMVSTLLTLLNGVNDRGPVLVIATTNFKDAIDPALMRSGRFDNKVFFPAPDESERTLILKVITASWKHSISEENINTLARNTPHFTGADLDLLCRRAQIEALSRVNGNVDTSETAAGDREVQPCDFFGALQKVQPAASSTNPLPYKPLHHLVGKLVATQVDVIIQEIMKHVPLKHTSADMTSSAAFAKFCCSSLLVDFDPVVYIHAKDDAALLSTVAEAVFNALAVDNTVKVFDFGLLARTNKPVPYELSTALCDRSLVVGLFNVDAFSTPANEKGKTALFPALDKMVRNRDRMGAPVIIVTGLNPPEAYGDEFYRIFGRNVVELKARPPTKEDCENYLSEFMMKETAKIIKSDGSIEVVEKRVYDEQKYDDKLRLLASSLAGRHMDVILCHHARMSKALWLDRENGKKKRFLDAIIDVIKKCKKRKPSEETPRKRGEQGSGDSCHFDNSVENSDQDDSF